MRQLRNLQERKQVQLELPLGYQPRTAGHDGKRVVRRPTATTLRPANDCNPFAASGTYPTRGVFRGQFDGVTGMEKRERVPLGLADAIARSGPGY